MKLKHTIFSEGACGLHVITQRHDVAQKWLSFFKKKNCFKSVELNSASEVVVGVNEYNEPYQYVVSAEKHGSWWSDEPPFRAGLRFLFINTVMNSCEESKLVTCGIIKKI